MLVTTIILALDKRRVIFWCDSTVVLSWIHAQPNLLLVFESNRVARIQELTEGKVWRHVSTSDNPVD